MSPAAAEPKVPVIGRVSLAAEDARALFPRQLGWTGVATAVALALTLMPSAVAHPDLAMGTVLGLGVLAAFPRQAHRGLLVALFVVLVTALAGLMGSGASSISEIAAPLAAIRFASRGVDGVQVLMGGAAAGLGICWLDRRGFDPWRVAHTVLATAAAAGLGWWVAHRLIPPTFAPLLYTGATALVAALLTSQGLLSAALRYRSAARIPNPARIQATLAEQYRGAALKAWKLDRELAAQSPDAETRDGLGEVAAWVYKLQWTLQSMDREADTFEEMGLTERIAKLTEEAEATDDAFTRERKLATVRHLDQLADHRQALAVERRRTAALVDYASAFLEEARAGLVLARVQPGEQTPNRIDDVLTRLRTYSAERDAHRRTAREVASLG